MTNRQLPPQNVTTRTRRATWLLALLSPLLVFSLATPAGASSTTPPVPEAVTGFNYNGIWAGNYRLDNGTFPVYCITAGADYPAGTYSNAHTVADSPDAERIAYIISRYGTSTGPNIQAAVAALVGKYFDTVNPNEKWDVLSAGQIADANQFWAEAAANSGPYTVNVTLPATVDQGHDGSATISVTSNSGNPVVGEQVNLSSSSVTLSAPSVTTDSQGQASINFSVPLSDTSGSYSIKASADFITKLVTYIPTGGGVLRQTVMGAADPSSTSVSSSSTYVPARAVSLVKYSSSSSTTPIPGATYALSTSSGSPVSSFVTGSSPVALGEFSVGSSYSLTETAAPAGYYIASSTPITFTVASGSTPQLVVVTDPAIPTISLSTAVSTHTLTLGSTATDNVTLAGNDGEPGTVSGQLYGPLPEPSGGCSTLTSSQWASAPLYASLSAPSVSSSATTSLSTAVSKFGCFSWADSISLAPSKAAASSPVGAPTETFLVPGPSFGTTVQHANVLVGGSLIDVVNVTLPAGISATLTGSLYGPLPGPCASLNWSSAPVAGSLSTLVVTASGAVSTSAITATSPGCYSFAETLTLANGQSISTAPGAPGETVLVSTVPVTTTTTTTIVTHTTVPQVISGGGGPPGPWNPYLLFGMLTLVFAAVGLTLSSRLIRSRS